MESATIIKDIIFPLIIKSAHVEVLSISDSFWEQFASDFLNFEIDATPTYNALYNLELCDPESVFKQLPEAYINFIKEIAENYVLGINNSLVQKLLECNNEIFLDEVAFLKTLQNIIIKSNRQQLKKDLPQLYDRLIFNLDEATIREVAIKKSRLDLKEKFKQWDKEILEEESATSFVKFSLSNETTDSIIREPHISFNKSNSNSNIFHWLKYAAVVFFVLGLGIWFYYNQVLVVLPNNNVVNAPVKPESNSNSAIYTSLPSPVLKDVTSVVKKIPVIESGRGFASGIKIIMVKENNQKARIMSILDAITKYQSLLNKEIVSNKVGDSSRIIFIKTKITTLQKELALLKDREKKYFFDGKGLLLYGSNFAKENAIVFYEDKYYLKQDSNFFLLSIDEQPQNLKKENNSNITEMLNSIIFQ